MTKSHIDRGRDHRSAKQRAQATAILSLETPLQADEREETKLLAISPISTPRLRPKAAFVNRNSASCTLNVSPRLAGDTDGHSMAAGYSRSSLR
jgi:hypothetical protein